MSREFSCTEKSSVPLTKVLGLTRNICTRGEDNKRSAASGLIEQAVRQSSSWIS
jgi:hypothetical protein